ncbi:MAG: serine/threonine protein kinase [Cyanomargarita calcarea GSE-NOS-MK-12-04C]|jgi:WD40 repeat protein|uniref:Serine/threonine protein kinase n=1 Tax=Cyanomargarita calcarea GSE-NOS-MK-12-04C TaxID=2839659 RepID=A0A951QQT4_9CYAN|nr:serine/threonine protein kinase [Cyanomargarita calcarea GSE-NOS-MK-12-04C]
MLLQQRYRLLKQIGKGGFAKTFLAVDEGEFPAIPCVVQQFKNKNFTSEVFEQKVQQLLELGKHPQIPNLLAYFQQENDFYLVQEFIEGSNLATLVEELGAFSETQIWHLLENLLPILKFIHEHNLIHCDIKPENIILTSRTADQGKDLILVDFSAVQLVTQISRLQTPAKIGSPEYAAPEQIQSKPVFASDLYSLGVICIYLLTQIPPFDLFDVANDCWVWRHYLSNKLSERLGKILDKLLEYSTNQRYQSADEVMQALGIQSPILNVQSQITNPLWECVHTFTTHLSTSFAVNSIAISCDGNTLASGSDDKTIRLWDLNSKQLVATLTGHSQAVKSVAFSPDGEMLASASDDKTIKLWNLNTHQEINTLIGHSRGVKSIVFYPGNAGILASGSWDKTIKLWNVSIGTEISTLAGHQLQVSAVAFSPISPYLASASFDRTIRLWKLPVDFASKKKFENCPCYTLSGHTWAVLTLAFSPDGKILATGSDDNTINLWDANNGQLIHTLLGHSWSVVALTFSTNGETLISGSCDRTIKLWSVSTAEEIATFPGHVNSVSAVAVSPVAQLIASGSRDKTIKLWQLV